MQDTCFNTGLEQLGSEIFTAFTAHKLISSYWTAHWLPISGTSLHSRQHWGLSMECYATLTRNRRMPSSPSSQPLAPTLVSPAGSSCTTYSYGSITTYGKFIVTHWRLVAIATEMAMLYFPWEFALQWSVSMSLRKWLPKSPHEHAYKNYSSIIWSNPPPQYEDDLVCEVNLVLYLLCS